MRFPLGPLVDPETDRLDLLIGQGLTATGHPLLGIVGGDPLEQEALRSVSLHDRRTAKVGTVLERAVLDIQAKSALPTLFIGTVAGKAILREDRADLATEIDLAFYYLSRPNIGRCQSVPQLAPLSIHSRIVSIWSEVSRRREADSGIRRTSSPVVSR